MLTETKMVDIIWDKMPAKTKEILRSTDIVHGWAWHVEDAAHAIAQAAAESEKEKMESLVKYLNEVKRDIRQEYPQADEYAKGWLHALLMISEHVRNEFILEERS